MSQSKRNESPGTSPKERLRPATLLAASAIVTAGIALWLHGLRESVAGPESIRIFLSLVLFQDYPAALWMLAIIPIALVPRVRTIGLHAVRLVGTHPWRVALLVATVLAGGARFVYHAHPLSMDEYAATFQAQAFAAGRWHGQWPAELVDWLLPPGFNGHFLAASPITGEVASMYWPGFALLVAPFAWLGLPWIANPLLGGASVLLVHRLALRLTGNVDAAGLAALLTMASPAVTMNAISQYSMTSHMVFNTAYVLLLLRPGVKQAFAAGLIGSIALVLHNPVPHTLVAAPWLAWLCARPDRRRVLPAIVLGYLPVCLLVGFGWPQLIAHLQAGGSAAASVEPAFGGGSLQDAIGRIGAVSVFRMPGLDTLEDRLMALAKLWLWAAPGMLLLALAGAHRSGEDVRVRLLAWSAVATLVGFLFVPVDQGHGWGFRYFHAAWFTLPVLAAVALVAVRGDVRARPGASSPLFGVVAACAVLSLVCLTTVRAVQVERFIAAHLGQLPEARHGTPEVILVHSRKGYYAGDLVQNDPFLRRRPLLLVSHGDPADGDMIERNFAGMQVLASEPTGIVLGHPDR